MMLAGRFFAGMGIGGLVSPAWRSLSHLLTTEATLAPSMLGFYVRQSFS
jgi:hypothetical protein